ncbi:hypothetical protein [Demequina capsici]|uniref:Tail terminator n=1 Tax=Demequina capsici TaxID=3075620 RepID=A0AA96FAU1_9MICO|nr:hypothetical protein [Demequina sp. OYTSA14]WNM25241.1 hypothetical protein RN606_03580 [Demequina sp. OYTSA14]
MSLRTDLAAAISAHAVKPKAWKVYAWAYSPDNLSAPAVVVRQGKTTKNTRNPRLYRDTEFMVGLMVPGLDPEKVEDDLDVGSETLLDILEAIDFPGLVWSEGNRVKFDDKFHGYDVTVTITNTKE